MTTKYPDPWPWHFIPDGRDNDDVCSVCLERCNEEDIEAIVDTNGTQHYACSDCHEAIMNDFKEAM